MKNKIIIQDWAGNILFKGRYDNNQVDEVLDANRCSTCVGYGGACRECDGTGYSGDFEVMWEDSNRTDNVYEFINY